MAKKRAIEEKEQADEDEQDFELPSDDGTDEETEDAPEGHGSDGPVSFLDSFYGLASSIPAERSESAQILLNHCLLGPDANIKDASYTFKRLLNGLCSGRAAARQGYASAFASFLKIALEKGVMKQIQEDAAEGSPSLLSFIRNRLLMTCDPSQAEAGKFGKKKGSEERDYYFGRLFGILAVVRSGILVPSEETDEEELQTVLDGFASDLIELLNHKKWMREPASFAIISFLNTFYERSSTCELSSKIVDHLVREIVIPTVFVEPSKKHKSFVGQLNAEQIAIGLSIQGKAHLHKEKLPSPLDRAIMTKDSMPALASALSATSAVAYPRTHVVWDVIWSYLSEASDKAQNGRPPIRYLRDVCPVDGGSASGMVEAMVESVICDSLLGLKEGVGSASHEKKALALTLVKVLSGAQYMSTTDGLFVISAEAGLLDTCILSSEIVQKLFIDVICAGRGKRGGDNLLKPLATHILESIAESPEFLSGDDIVVTRRLTIAKALIRCEPRFDRTTRTSTVAKLLCLEATSESSPAVYTMWEEYFAYLKTEILNLALEPAEGNKVGANDSNALDYVGLLVDASKQLLRLGIDGEKFTAFKEDIARCVLAFFMSAAFFDCSEMKKPKKKKDLDPYSSAGLRLKSILKEKEKTELSHYIRSIFSARFFSLLTDAVSVSTMKNVLEEDEEDEQKESTNKKKDSRMLALLLNVSNGWEKLEEMGASRLTDGSDENIAEVQKFVFLIQKDACGFTPGDDDKSKATQGCVTGCAILASTLYLHFLHCGRPSVMNDDDVDQDDEDDEESELKEMISDLASACQGLLDQMKGEEKPSNVPEIENPLDDLAQVCAGVLASPFGAGSEIRGASPSLLREAVKFAWVGGLGAAAFCSTITESLLNEQVMSTLLSSVGIDKEVSENESDDEEEGSSGEDEEDSNDDDERIFTKAASEGMDVEYPDKVDNDDGGEMSKETDDEVEIDKERLQTLLLQEIDESEGEDLEHHEGADGALVKLIKLRQEARKAGQQAREKLETSAEIRCLLLLETLLTNPSRRWKDKTIKDMIMTFTLPLVRSIRSLEKAIKSASEGKLAKKSPVGVPEKQAMLKKQVVLLQTKLCKSKLISSPACSDKNVILLIGSLLDEARKADSPVQSSCCSAAIVTATRLVFLDDQLDEMSALFDDVVNEWATKRTTRLEANLFENIIQQQPLIAQAILALPLCKASTDARSSFSKGEAFRLLSLFFGQVSTWDGKARALLPSADSSLQALAVTFSATVVATLDDPEMTKAKRVRDVLKVVEKFVIALTKTESPLGEAAIAKLSELKTAITAFNDNAENKAVANACDKLSASFEALLETQNKLLEETRINETEAISSKKKKSKKSKKGKK